MTLAHYRTLSQEEKDAFHTSRRQDHQDQLERLESLRRKIEQSRIECKERDESWRQQAQEYKAARAKDSELGTTTFRVYGTRGKVAQLVADCYRYASSFPAMGISDHTSSGLLWGESCITITAPCNRLLAYRSHLQLYLHARHG